MIEKQTELKGLYFGAKRTLELYINYKMTIRQINYRNVLRKYDMLNRNFQKDWRGGEELNQKTLASSGRDEIF